MQDESQCVGGFPALTILIQQGFVSTEFYFEIHNNFSCITAICYTDFFLFQENVDVKYMHNKLTVQNTVHISTVVLQNIYT